MYIFILYVQLDSKLLDNDYQVNIILTIQHYSQLLGAELKKAN